MIVKLVSFTGGKTLPIGLKLDAGPGALLVMVTRKYGVGGEATKLIDLHGST
jgi:hypothetical protein